ncbi:Dihydrofolate synthase / Folylpolyglutamate synthase [Streptococcus sp. DD10]|uniref:bifunctional folylpolyglutamate synthase/dihydrofolate synthase n=1 Tax=Streptococcus sp. DD10 TaxID=1777878 RepID=UPI00079B5D67|nr:folylpolyglutamate synthase/dihydrofolate synthase family protein [Streptococcus sp. DD10]KXT74686.1 Dihydrofolate synthase / Folylpolyglutamate synthase [Streptococcus sp. DD10]
MKTIDLSWLITFRTDQPNFGLERMEKLLALRNHPHKSLPVIHLAGTNGKGSTLAHLSQLLQALGLKVGVFSSPYLIDYHDQISINGTSISEAELQEFLHSYKEVVLHHQKDLLGLTEFEIITAISFDYFSQKEVDIAIMEVGMGGTLDSTNVCQPILTAITTIGLDHVALLGDNLEAIAEQKAGIIKEQIPLVTGKIAPAALQVIIKRANSLEAPILSFEKDYQIKNLVSSEAGESFSYQSSLRTCPQITSPLLGQHQAENAGLALTIFDSYCQQEGRTLLSNEVIQQAFHKIRWPGRMEIVTYDPLILIDGAHNPHAMERLVDNLNSRYPNKTKHILFSCIKTKEETTMVRQLQNVHSADITLTSFEDSRAISAQQMQKLARTENLHFCDWQSFLKKTFPKGDMLVITGSLYFLAQVRPYLLKEKQ